MGYNTHFFFGKLMKKYTNCEINIPKDKYKKRKIILAKIKGDKFMAWHRLYIYSHFQ